MDILLVNPGAIRYDYATEHLGICSLKSYVCSQGFAAETMDMAIEELSVQDAVKTIIALKPKMVGISLLQDSQKRGLNLTKALRKAQYNGIIVLGGYFATFASFEILRDFPEIDYVIRGEGELTLVELMQFVFTKPNEDLSKILGLSYRDNNCILENPSRPLINNLDVLPPPDRKYASKILANNSHIRIYATRGCWGKCTFCDIIGMYAEGKGKAWRRRSVKHLVDEIEQLQIEFKTSHFIFNDDQFLVKGKKSYAYVEEFVAEIEQRNLSIFFELMCRADTVNRKIMSRLKEVGLQRVFLGLESFDEAQLQRYKKAISLWQNLKAIITLYQLKIDVIASVILADAYTTLLDLLKQFFTLFILRGRYFNSKHCQISVNKKLEIYPGSAVYQEYKSKGLLTKDHYLDGYDFKLKLLTDLRLKLFTLEENMSRFVLKPRSAFQNFAKRLQWQYAQVKAIVASLALSKR